MPRSAGLITGTTSSSTTVHCTPFHAKQTTGTGNSLQLQVRRAPLPRGSLSYLCTALFHKRVATVRVLATCCVHRGILCWNLSLLLKQFRVSLSIQLHVLPLRHCISTASRTRLF